jgi:hypothetical protein
MGWETRNGKQCYYRKVRVDGRVRSIYCGTGERARLAALEDERRRAGACGVAQEKFDEVGRKKDERLDEMADGEFQVTHEELMKLIHGVVDSVLDGVIDSVIDRAIDKLSIPR